MEHNIAHEFTYYVISQQISARKEERGGSGAIRDNPATREFGDNGHNLVNWHQN